MGQSHIVLALVQNLRPGGRFEQLNFVQNYMLWRKKDRTKCESKSEDKGENRSACGGVMVVRTGQSIGYVTGQSHIVLTLVQNLRLTALRTVELCTK